MKVPRLTDLALENVCKGFAWALKNQCDLSPFHALPTNLIERLLETIQILGLSIDTPHASSLEKFIIKASPQTLSFVGTAFPAAQMIRKDFLDSLTELKSLVLDECSYSPVSRENFESILEIVRNNRLDRLYLGFIHFDQSQINALAEALSVNTSLRALTLRNCFGEEGWICVCEALLSHPSLLSLDLISNGIEAPGLLALAELIRQNKTLLELKATYHRFKDTGSVLLFTALANNKTLQVCDLSDNVLDPSKIPPRVIAPS